MLLLGASANAAITRISGPTTQYNETRRMVFFDAAYDTADHLYLAAWGTQALGPVNGMLFNDSGQQLSTLPFALSDGAQQSGWTRIIYSPETGRFLVSYVRIMGVNHHQKVARFVTISNNAPQLGPEIILDDWLGDSGTATGIVYASASGKFLVTWSHYNGSLPVTFVATITAAGAPSCGPNIGPCTIVSTPTDGETDSEIACDPASRKCLVIGKAWGILDGSGKSAHWARFIDDATGAPLGASSQYVFNGGGANLDPPGVVYTPASSVSGAHFLIAAQYAGAILGFTADSASGAFTYLGPILQDTTGTNGVGYGFPQLRFNTGSQTSILGANTWIGWGAVQEMNNLGQRTSGGFDLIPEALVQPGNANSGNDFTVVAPNANTGGLMALEDVFFEFIRTSIYSGVASAPPPPPPPPCTVTPATTSITVPFLIATEAIGVATDTASCSWTATSGAGWINIVSGASGTGAGTVTFTVGFNATGTGRTGTITIGGKLVSVVQPGVNTAAISDMTGDGFSDLMTRNTVTGQLAPLAVGQLAIWTMPSLHYWDGSPVPNVPLDYKVVGTGDLNGDGFADVVWQQQSTGNLYAWIMQGPTVIATPALSIPTVGTGWQVRAVGDLNGDGRADLVFQNSVTGGLAVWLMNGAVVIGTAPITDGVGNQLIMPDPNWVIAGAGDLNRDGRADLIWQNQVTGGLGAWIMNGSGVQMMHSLSPAFVPNTDYKIVGVGDVNADFIADIIWIKQSTGELFVWCMNGFSANVYAGILMFPGGAPAVLGANWTVVGPG